MFNLLKIITCISYIEYEKHSSTMELFSKLVIN